MQIPAGKKVYFLSDFHLGVPDHASSLVRRKIVAFLERAKADAATIFIVGDLLIFGSNTGKLCPKALCEF